jgi:hypothetical protein
LVIELSRSFAFKSAQPIAEEDHSSMCTFHVPYNSLLPFAVFHRLLAAIPQVTVVMQRSLA